MKQSATHAGPSSKSKSSPFKRREDFGDLRSAGVSPAIFSISTLCKNAGETPALQRLRKMWFVASLIS
jgi:hypothetical protein